MKGRREVWAGGLKVSSKSFSVKQTRKIKDGDDGSSEVAEAMEVLAYQGIDASVWMDAHVIICETS